MPLAGLPSPRLPAFCRRSAFWLTAFFVWGCVLWTLSDGPLPGPRGPHIYGLDKILHFGFYFGGAGLLAAALFLRSRDPAAPNWGAIVVVVVLVLSVVGILDEWHQSWYPERSGNDPGDWLADAYGALAGALVFRRMHSLLL